MRRLSVGGYVLLISSIVFLMCSCSQQARLKSFDVQKAFTTNVTANKQNFSFSLSLTVNSDQDIRLVFNSPKSLKGFGLRTENGKLVTNINGISDALPANYLTDTSPLCLITQGVKQFVFGQNKYTENADGNICTSKLIGSVEAQATFSPDGKLLSISAPSLSFFAKFN